MIMHIYRPLRSWGKVIFSQASVILSRGGLPGPGGCLVCGGLLGGCLLRGVPAPRRCLLLGGGVPGPGGCAWWRPPNGTANATGGTHPTGMHSSYVTKWVFGYIKLETLYLYLDTECFVQICLMWFILPKVDSGIKMNRYRNEWVHNPPFLWSKKTWTTRKHSSRMRTVRCSGRRGGGDICPGGLPQCMLGYTPL